MKDALLEIGSEELPATFIRPGMLQLKSLAEESLKASGLSYASVETFGTPRRLAVVIHGMSESSPDQKKTVTGPPAQIAKDAQGQWTPAAMGFARKQGLKPSDLTIENDRLCAVVHMKGVATRQLLADLFPQWISRLEFPKSMEWEPTHFRYPRPIRWICALLGSDLVSFSVSGVRSTRWTLGLGPWAPKKLPIAHASKYELTLKNQCVLVDPGARQEMTKRCVEQAVKRVHGKIHLSAGLLEEVTNLVEHPVAILGNFNPAYLDLPKEVLVTCLEHHQKFFPVEDASGNKLLPHFVGIRNGMSVNQENVHEGYERVLAARLADARFFYDQDCRVSLSLRVDALKDIVFQKELGTLHDKVQRIKALLTDVVAAIPGSEVWRADVETTVSLCKADLTTAMVREFPELQGIMGRIYAEVGGLEARVSRALEEHYWPITLVGNLPSSDLGAVISLADKLDTLVGDYAVGIEPTGSADPYGLRRAAVGILRILEAKRWAIPLEELIDKSRKTYPAPLMAQRGVARTHLCQFMQQRLTGLLLERGYKIDEIEAVLSERVGVVSETLAKLEALHAVRKKSEFEPLAIVFKRADNIIRKSGLPGPAQGETSDGAVLVIPERFREDSERKLYAALQGVQLQVEQLIAKKNYQNALEIMVPLREPLDRFFESVMVNDPNMELRANRFAVLQILTNLFRQIADFSKLQNA